MNWQDKAYQALLKKDYPRVASLYRGLLKKEPDTLSHYWYLGTVYLLQNLEAEAQVMWQSVLSRGDSQQRKEWKRELETVLDTEAKRQQELGDLETVSLLRYHLQEIVPDSINNLLSWVNLSLDLEEFEPGTLLDHNFFQNIDNDPDRELLLTIIPKILAYPDELTLDFARRSLPYLQEVEDRFIPVAFEVAIAVASEQQSPAFSAEIMKLCLELKPDNISLLEQLVNFNILAENFEGSVEAAD